MSRKDDIAQINQILFTIGLEKGASPKVSKQKELLPMILQLGHYYILAAKDTLPKDWDARRFSAYTEGRFLLVFLTKSDAQTYALKNNIISISGEPMCAGASLDTFQRLLSANKDLNLFHDVRIYTKLPLYVDYDVKSFTLFNNNTEEVRSLKPKEQIEQKEMPPTLAHPKSQDDKRWLLVDDVKACLDASEVKVRRRLDPSMSFSNPHTLMEKLLFANKIDFSSLEEELHLPSGFLKLYIHDTVSDAVSKAVLVRMLGYFGLSSYLYQFKKHCGEVLLELKDDPYIDNCGIKQANIHTTEPFTLKNIRRGVNQDGFYVYQLNFTSEKRNLSMIVSSPYGCVVGKKYELSGVPYLDGVDQEPEEEPDDSSETAKQQRTPDEILEDFAIRYLKESENLNSRQAKEKYHKFDMHPDLQKEFARFAQSGKLGGRIKVREYSARMLVNELHFSPYEAYTELCLLREKPSETLQFLKYRRTDPQYQKQKKKG